MIIAGIAAAGLLGMYALILWLTRAGGPCDATAFWDQEYGRRDHAAPWPSGQAPGGAHAPGEAGKRARGEAALSDSGGSAAGERDAPSLPAGLHSTAGRAGRPRAFSGDAR